MPVERAKRGKVLIIKDVGSLIITIRNQKVIVDSDLAEIYGVETRRLNEQVKRNPERFPEDFILEKSVGPSTLSLCPNVKMTWNGNFISV